MWVRTRLGRFVGLTGSIPDQESFVGRCWINRFFDADNWFVVPQC
jgi:hypothetical protein